MLDISSNLYIQFVKLQTSMFRSWIVSELFRSLLLWNPSYSNSYMRSNQYQPILIAIRWRACILVSNVCIRDIIALWIEQKYALVRIILFSELLIKNYNEICEMWKLTICTQRELQLFFIKWIFKTNNIVKQRKIKRMRINIDMRKIKYEIHLLVFGKTLSMHKKDT